MRQNFSDQIETSPAESLSGRQRAILPLLARGLSNKEVARSLGITPETVKSHLKSIYWKLGVSRRSEAVAHGMRLGLSD